MRLSRIQPLLISVTSHVFIFLSALVALVSSDNDIIRHAQFDCRYYGGSIGMVQCNCTEHAEEFYLQPGGVPSDVTVIELNHCSQVRFARNAIADLRNLRQVNLNSISSLDFEENSMNWYGYRDITEDEERFDLAVPSVKINVKRSRIHQISPQAFRGRLSEINFEDVIIENIKSFAFSNLLQNEHIIFKRVEIRNIEPQAFKKFGTEHLTLDGVNVDTLPSRTFSNINVYQRLSIINSRFTNLRSGAFYVFQPNTFEVINTMIDQLDGEAFKVTTTGDVIFRHNVFRSIQDGAFLGIRLSSETLARHTVTFESNTFSSLTIDSLAVVGFDSRFIDININETCNCDNIENNLHQSEFYNEIRCLGEKDYVTVREYRSQNCRIASAYTTIIVIVCVVVLAIGLAIAGFYVYYRTVYLSKKYKAQKMSKKPGNLSLIVPDGRTYKETEIHVVLEKTDLLTTEL